MWFQEISIPTSRRVKCWKFKGGVCVSEARFSKEFIKLFQRVRGFKLEKPSVGDTDIVYTYGCLFWNNKI